MQKRKDHYEMATDCSFAKNLPPKMRLFFAFAKLANHLFLEFLTQLTPIIMMKEWTKKTACQSHQAFIEKFAAGIDFMSSIHF